jgi:hypothetical protein
MRESSFPAMRARAAMEPWASGRPARRRLNAVYVPGTGNAQIAQNLIRFSSAAALACVLDDPTPPPCDSGA